jgi:hypothetical protein
MRTERTAVDGRIKVRRKGADRLRLRTCERIELSDGRQWLSPHAERLRIGPSEERVLQKEGNIGARPDPLLIEKGIGDFDEQRN